MVKVSHVLLLRPLTLTMCPPTSVGLAIALEALQIASAFILICFFCLVKFVGTNIFFFFKKKQHGPQKTGSFSIKVSTPLFGSCNSTV